MVERKGSWYSMEGESLGQGREQACQFLRENDEIYRKIEQRVLGCGPERPTEASTEGRRGRKRRQPK